MERLGFSDFGYSAKVDGQKMEFATETELDEYMEGLDEESESPFIFSQNSHSL